ncbi:MAG: hypothetical protein QM564_03115 [Bergeyella sp.]
MNYLDLINKFWVYNDKHRFGAVSIVLYLFILQKWDEENQTDWVQISDYLICDTLKLTRPTVKKSKNKLRDFGLIQFQIKSGFATHYRIIFDYTIAEPNGKMQKTKKKKETPKSPKSKNSNEAVLDLFFSPKSSADKKESVLANEISSLVNGISKVPEQPEEPEQVKQEVPKSPLSKNKIKALPDDVPTLDEFIKHAQTFEIYTPEYDFSLSAKYEQWVSDEWKNGNGKPIKNWKAALKSTFPYLKAVKSESAPKLITIKRPKSTYDE